MTTVTVPIPEFPKTTMTSREIAELTGKEHRNVMAFYSPHAGRIAWRGGCPDFSAYPYAWRESCSSL